MTKSNKHNESIINARTDGHIDASGSLFRPKSPKSTDLTATSMNTTAEFDSKFSKAFSELMSRMNSPVINLIIILIGIKMFFTIFF